MIIQELNAAALRHWHPVMRAPKLRKKPVQIKILGESIVVFRTPDGIAALADRCPHRGARLSAGYVEHGNIVCPYHLWGFDREGSGYSPCNPRMHPVAKALEATEYLGLVWVRSRGANGELPALDTSGLDLVGHRTGRIDAPYPIVVDNFTEIEHSPTNHKVLAFDARGIREVEPHFEEIENSIHVVYQGPQRPVNWAMAHGLGWKAGSQLTIDFRVHFDPLRWVYDFHWVDTRSGKRAPIRLRELALITPRDDGTTSVFLQFYISHWIFNRYNPLRFLAKPIFLQHANREFVLDKRICENVASTGTEQLRGLQLGKFDRVLSVARRLIATVYRDDKPPAQQLISAS